MLLPSLFLPCFSFSFPAGNLPTRNWRSWKSPVERSSVFAWNHSINDESWDQVEGDQSPNKTSHEATGLRWRFPNWTIPSIPWHFLDTGFRTYWCKVLRRRFPENWMDAMHLFLNLWSCCLCWSVSTLLEMVKSRVDKHLQYQSVSFQQALPSVISCIGPCSPGGPFSPSTPQNIRVATWQEGKPEEVWVKVSVK